MGKAEPTHTFSVEELGDFTVRLPTVRDSIKIGVMKTRDLLQGVNPESLDTVTDNFAHMVATMSVVTVSAPRVNGEPFNFLEIEDPQTLYKIYGQFDAWRLQFRGGRTAEAQG